MARSLRNKFLLGAMVVALAVPLAAPAHALDKEDMGTLLGAGLGGLLGNQFGGGEGKVITTSLGVFLGGLGGRSIGSSLDRADRGYHRSGHYNNYPPYRGQQSYYQPTYVAPYAPPPTRVVYVREPEPVYIREGYVDSGYGGKSGRYCREYSSSVRIGNQWRDSYGTACMQPDGSWEIVE